ncbi:MAG TPA: hypothetical protein DEB36_05460 [Porphyromonadaceae bacterium]|jgi:hypothetical protein|nr:hypothetical protein [Porphyromonadaceae bacterium]
MRLNKLFMIGAIALGLVACNADDQPEVNQHETDSYASITVKFPGTVGTRALPDDWNKQNTWTGRDSLNTVTVFLVNLDRATVDYTTFTKAAFNAIDANGVLQPNLAMKATAGDMIRAYVVINGQADILGELQGTGAAGFAAKFAGLQTKIASQLASYDATANKETIMMTNDADAYSFRVLPGISESDAKTGTTNNVQVKVERVVSRAFMTVAPEETEGGWTVNAIIVGNNAVPIAKVTGVEYAVGQSNRNFYLMKQTDYATPDPVYTFTPTDYATWFANKANFDYTGLGDFTPITQWAYSATGVGTQLGLEETSKFVLPVNHMVNLTDPVAGRPYYKKGNTTYFEIRATFLPLEVDGVAFSGTTAPASLFWGEVDRKFYTVRDSAEASGQKATEFKDGIMKYVLWLNPNSLVSTIDMPNPMVSPTVRNQVYHAHINAFERMGLPNNPLDPNDPDNTLNPDNPINVEDPLKTDFTYLSVKVEVLPWTIHTYSYNLTDPGTMY